MVSSYIVETKPTVEVSNRFDFKSELSTFVLSSRATNKVVLSSVAKPSRSFAKMSHSCELLERSVKRGIDSIETRLEIYWDTFSYASV